MCGVDSDYGVPAYNWLVLTNRLKKNFSPAKNYRLRFRPEFISKGYGPLAGSFDRAFANPKQKG